ncbi:hypothetical protein KKB64_04445 [Patescibacteria group bacterium]|nr:hypothetical protein [Patescibacteria group bacterium]
MTDNQTSDNNPQADTTQTSDSSTNNGSQVLLNLESLIKTHITGIDNRKAELKKQREMLTSAFANDETYREAEAKAKEAAKEKGKIKANILLQPAVKQNADKIKELTCEIKEMSNALSDYLREYSRMSGTNEIEGDDGEICEIVYVAKLVKKSKRSRD